MNKYQQFFQREDFIVEHFFIYFAFAAVLALYLTIKSDSKYKYILFFISFYLLTGNYNDLLLIRIPGLSFFKIPPVRFIYLMLLGFIIKKTWFKKREQKFTGLKSIPWFEVALYGYIILLSISIFINDFPQGFKVILDALAFVIIIKAFRLMADKPSYDLIGRSIIIGAVISSLISIGQFTIEPDFLRIGDSRGAFGGLLRSNGLFGSEYYNGYYLIIAIAWTVVTVKKDILKVVLVTLFSIGVITTFMRMSWLILILVLLTYLLYIRKTEISKLVLLAMTGLTLILSISILYYRDIKNSSLVQERLTQQVDGRKGYYSMVFDNIGKEPFFGYGTLKNKVYYENLLRITGDKDRAEANTGGLHSGYFTSLFLYGVPAFMFFTLFVFLAVFYYAKSIKHNLYFVIPFLVSIIYLLGNLTNTFLFITYLSLLFAIHIGIGMGINKIEQVSAEQLEE